MTAQSHVSPVRRARHRLRTRVSEHPGLYLRFARHKYPGPSPEVIGSLTELVIDGYTRCGTTFAVYAFQLAQARPVRLAHHLHAPAQLIEAARKDVPTVVLIREPQGALLSQLVREPDVALPDALVAYARFYACLMPYRDRFVIADFEQVTGDFGSVIRRLNERFGTDFAEFAHTEANVQECLGLMKARGTLSRKLLGFESGVATVADARSEQERLGHGATPAGAGEEWVPSTERERLKVALQEHWRDPALARARDRAQHVYQAFLGR